MGKTGTISATCALFCALATVACIPNSWAQTAPDASAVGPLAVTDSEFYQFPASCDPQVLPCTGAKDSTHFVELWAQIYRPSHLSNPPYPLLIVLHGNHDTCSRFAFPWEKIALGLPANFPNSELHIDDNSEYTSDGTCPAGYFPAPNHLGYDYLATRLASWGYIVVSINANRGITSGEGMAGDAELIFARARLVLRHLALLNQWNAGNDSQVPPNPEGSGLPTVLKGALCFTHVGLFGHSRGGEGVRAAYVLYRDGDPLHGAANWQELIPTLAIKGIFEIAPTDLADDGFSGPPLAPAGPINPEGLPWNVLLPMCDGDVSDLEGIRPFDRMMLSQGDPFEAASPTQKSAYTVWGADHDFYNDQWQVNESFGCLGAGNTALFPQAPGSPTQRLSALSSVLAFFRGNISGSKVSGAHSSKFRENFDPMYAIPADVIDEDHDLATFPTRVDRTYSPSPSSSVSLVFDDFTASSGINSDGVPDDVSNITINNFDGPPEEDATLPAGAITWVGGGSSVFFQTNWTATGASGMDLTALPNIGAAQTLEFRVARQEDSSLNHRSDTDFSIALVGADGSTTQPVLLSDLLGASPLVGPVGSADNPNPIMQTVRVPLTDFGNLEGVEHQASGVLFTFDRAGSGAINLSNVRMTNSLGAGSNTPGVRRESVALNSVGTPQSHLQPSPLPQSDSSPSSGAPPTRMNRGTIAAIAAVGASRALGGQSGVEIRITSPAAFPVRDQPLILVIGGNRFVLGRHRPDDHHEYVFTLTRAEFQRLADGAPVSAQLGVHHPREVWSLGRLNKAMLSGN